jgi:hypothetical protein
MFVQQTIDKPWKFSGRNVLMEEITMEMETMMNENALETHPQTLVAINEARIWTRGNNLLVGYLDFYTMVTLDDVIGLGLDAIQPDCLRLDWEELDDFGDRHKRVTSSEFLQEILDWMDAIDREFQTL